MLSLPLSLAAWPGTAFATVLKQELEPLAVAELPLQQALSKSSYVLDQRPEIIVIHAAADAAAIHVRAGVFYMGVVAGCNCADDPTPVEANTEYCELLLKIDRSTATTTVELLAD